MSYTNPTFLILTTKLQGAKPRGMKWVPRVRKISNQGLENPFMTKPTFNNDIKNREIKPPGRNDTPKFHFFPRRYGKKWILGVSFLPAPATLREES